MSSSNSDLPSHIADSVILTARGPRNSVDPARPYAFLVEPERAADGQIEDVATLFLTNRECPFRCLFCDLWKNTTIETVPVGAIPAQIDYALAQLPAARHIKLYNSGNFFDRKAIPIEDHAAIAQRVHVYRTVIVENHPKLCSDDILRFRDRLDGELEVAMGLETIHPDVLPRLNKRMTVADFDAACRFLRAHDVHVRTFILLKPPGLGEDDGIEWAIRSIAHAFDQGARCCSVIPTRAGNGIMERLERERRFAPPVLGSLESVLEQGIALQRGRVFVDLWDAERFATCRQCASERIERMHKMNLHQRVEPPVSCDCSRVTP
jgi:radical SAM enzyme (TIGR01210 family)